VINSKELTEKIQEDLNSYGSDFNFIVGNEITKVFELPKNIQNWKLNSKDIYGLWTTEGGEFEAVENQELASIDANLSFYVENEQKDELFAILSAYIAEQNAKPFYSKDGNYAVIAVFDVLRFGSTSIFQGDDRVPLNVGITYTVAKKGILSNDIEVSINGSKMLVLNATFSMAKGATQKQFNGSVLTKGKPLSKAKTMAIVVVNTKTPIINAIKSEILDDETISTVYNITYNDGDVEYTTPMYLNNGVIGLTAGAVASITAEFSTIRR
jgi:hypothetical protein